MGSARAVEGCGRVPRHGMSRDTPCGRCVHNCISAFSPLGAMDLFSGVFKFHSVIFLRVDSLQVIL